MEESYLHDRLARHGITTVIPEDAAVRAELYRIIYEELSFNEFRPDSRATIVDAIRSLAGAGCRGVHSRLHRDRAAGPTRTCP